MRKKEENTLNFHDKDLSVVQIPLILLNFLALTKEDPESELHAHLIGIFIFFG